jgi:cbb3-type cytochrome oxidase subunit 3
VNTLMREAAASIEMGWLLGVMTAVFFAAFLYWVWYAYAPSHKRRLEEAALLPFDGGEG